MEDDTPVHISLAADSFSLDTSCEVCLQSLYFFLTETELYAPYPPHLTLTAR